MADSITAINTKIADILDNDATLTSLGLKKIFVGIPYSLMDDWMPSIEIMIESKLSIQESTGNRSTYQYDGYLLVSVIQQNLVVPTSKVIRITAYDTLVSYIVAIFSALATQANKTLGNLSFDNGTVITFGLYGNIQAGAGRRNEMDDNIHNFAIIPFQCQTRESD